MLCFHCKSIINLVYTGGHLLGMTLRMETIQQTNECYVYIQSKFSVSTMKLDQISPCFSWGEICGMALRMETIPQTNECYVHSAKVPSFHYETIDQISPCSSESKSWAWDYAWKQSHKQMSAMYIYSVKVLFPLWNYRPNFTLFLLRANLWHDTTHGNNPTNKWVLCTMYIFSQSALFPLWNYWTNLTLFLLRGNLWHDTTHGNNPTNKWVLCVYSVKVLSFPL